MLICLALVTLSSRAQAPAPAAADPSPRFAILEFEIEGNSVLPQSAIEAAVLPFMGESRQLADAQAAREALEKAYQQAGYLTVFVDLPEQRVDDGVVRLNVTEGRVERLRVTGSRYYDQGYIRAHVDELAPGKVPNFNEVQRQLAGINRDERQIQPVLRPGLEPGTVQADLKVSDRLPLAASLEVHNRHPADTTPWRVQANLRYDNLFQRDHGLSLTAITAPEKSSESRVVVANYTVPLGNNTTLVAYAVDSNSNVETLGAATVVGKGTTFGLRWLRAYPAADATHSISLGADYKNLKEQVVAGSDALSTPLRYLPLQAGYTGTWFHDKGQTTLNASLVFALRRVLARRVECPGNIGPVDQFACKREGADGAFSYLRGDLKHSGVIDGVPGQWSARFGAQVATQPLASSEQYAIGGADSVRGYLEAEGSGDHALLGSFEWRSANLLTARPPAPDEPLSLAGVFNSAAVLGFVDVARAYISQPSAGQAAHVSLAGTGFGLRVRAAKAVDAEFDIAWPLKGTRSSPRNEPRVHVRLAAQF